MKAKAVRNKITGKYIHLKHDEFDDAMLVERSLPELREADITLEIILEDYSLEFPHLDISEFELIEFDLIESGVVGADIRNKLSPFKNLIALVGVYFLEVNEAKKILMKGIIQRDLKQARASLDYLTKLFE